MEYILYHASTESFKKFDEDKICKSETDAPFNGFWFSSKKDTSCAWVNPNYLKTCKITLNNPCTWETIRKFIKENEHRYSCTELRKELLKIGYDGIIYQDIPIINELELKRKNEIIFKDVKGIEYKLKVSNGYLDLYDKYDEYITGYYDLDDFLKQEETIVVTFSDKNIEILKEIKNPYW